MFAHVCVCVWFVEMKRHIEQTIGQIEYFTCSLKLMIFLIIIDTFDYYNILFCLPTLSNVLLYSFSIHIFQYIQFRTAISIIIKDMWHRKKRGEGGRFTANNHQYGQVFSRWFQEANSDHEDIFACVKSAYLFGMAIGFDEAFWLLLIISVLIRKFDVWLLYFDVRLRIV